MGVSQHAPLASELGRERLKSLIGASPLMQRLYRLIQVAGDHRFPTLILGESGTGKELVARAIHDLSSRRTQPFVPVDCSALSAHLAETELFGHVKGAFTDAWHDRAGLFEAAHGGTLFLDEIGELPLNLQVKLLRAIQEKEIRQVGGTRQIPTDARIIAATNRDLEAFVREGSFRQDLYFRLNVLQMNLPSLREHKSDIPLLVDHFLERFRSLQSAVQTFSPDAMMRLMAYDWPGNVRELENAVECGIVMSSGAIIEVIDLPSSVSVGSSIEPEAAPVTLREAEKWAIFRALEETQGNRIDAARILGMGKTTLYRKLKEYKEG